MDGTSAYSEQFSVFLDEEETDDFDPYEDEFPVD